MSRITEYVGSEGVVSSAYDHWRMENPKPGDLLQWPSGKLGMIQNVGTGFAESDEVHVVVTCGSAFLIKNGREASVSISGGPFTTLKIADLIPTLERKPANFWNWGDNLAGADMGVPYTLYRPVFKTEQTHYAAE